MQIPIGGPKSFPVVIIALLKVFILVILPLGSDGGANTGAMYKIPDVGANPLVIVIGVGASALGKSEMAYFGNGGMILFRGTPTS